MASDKKDERRNASTRTLAIPGEKKHRQKIKCLQPSNYNIHYRTQHTNIAIDTVFDALQRQAIHYENNNSNNNEYQNQVNFITLKAKYT